jgi:hypothetical protein
VNLTRQDASALTFASRVAWAYCVVPSTPC